MKRIGQTLFVILLVVGFSTFIPEKAQPFSSSSSGLRQSDFVRLAAGGFGDSANSYAWDIEVINGDIYVGTNRHHMWSLANGIAAGLGIDLPSIPGPAVETWGHPDWAEAMRGEIWRYRLGKWTRVHQSQVSLGPLPIVVPPGGPPVPPINGSYPDSYGYRALAEFNGNIYALGIGTWWPPMPLTRVLKSSSGDEGTWEDVTGVLGATNNPRALVRYNGKLCVSVAVPGDTPTGAGAAVIFCSSDPGTEGWTQVSEPGFGNSDNAEVYYLQEFNGFLYASTVNYNTGFEVWKTDGMEGTDGKYQWTCVVKDGFGDTYNQYGMTMEVLGDYLYVGTAVGAGLVVKNGQPVGTRAIDVIRIGTDDNAQLVVGAYTPVDPPPGWPVNREPLSKWPAGFGSPFNVYVWDMEVRDGWLYVATLDLGAPIVEGISDLASLGIFSNPQFLEMAMQPVRELGEALRQIRLSPMDRLRQMIFQRTLSRVDLNSEPSIVSTIMGRLFLRRFGGADLWKTKDGITWKPVTLNGFNNHKNYGLRKLVSDKGGLLVGTANPYTGDPKGGCEILFGR